MTLIAILAAPLIILGVVAFALILAFVHRVGRVTAELEAKKRQERGAPIRPEESPTPAPEAGASAGCADASPPAGEDDTWPDLPRGR